MARCSIISTESGRSSNESNETCAFEKDILLAIMSLIVATFVLRIVTSARDLNDQSSKCTIAFAKTE